MLTRVVAVVMLAVGSAFGVCHPDPAYSPTPVYRWDPPADDPEELAIGGYMLRWRWFGDPVWPVSCCMDFLPCQTVTDEDTGESWRLCPGTDYGVALQKFTNDSLQILEVCVEAVGMGDPWDPANRSIECSIADQSDLEGLQSSICMPELWRF